MEVVVLKCVPEPMAPSRGGSCLSGSAGRSSGTPRGGAPKNAGSGCRARSPASQPHHRRAGNNRSRKSPSLRPITAAGGKRWSRRKVRITSLWPGDRLTGMCRPLRLPRAGENCLWMVDQSLGARMAGDFPQERPFVAATGTLTAAPLQQDRRPRPAVGEPHVPAGCRAVGRAATYLIGVLASRRRVAFIDGVLAITVLTGPVLNAAANRWWADPLAATSWSPTPYARPRHPH